MGFDWLIYLGLLLLSTAITYLTRPKTSISGLKAGTIEAATAEEGTETFVIFGTRPVEGNVLWYGDKRTVAVKKSGGKK